MSTFMINLLVRLHIDSKLWTSSSASAQNKICTVHCVSVDIKAAVRSSPRRWVVTFTLHPCGFYIIKQVCVNSYTQTLISKKPAFML